MPAPSTGSPPRGPSGASPTCSPSCSAATAIGADDSFFDLGGHSLLATKLVAAVRSQCDVDIGVREVFELGTVAGLAEHIDVDVGMPTSQRPRLVAIPHEGPLQMSASQLRMWFQYRIDGPNPVNNIPFAARLTGPCDADALVEAVRDVVARHEMLRTTYREIDGVPYQIVNEAGSEDAPVAVRRARGDDDAWLQAELDNERRHVFDLEGALPIRAAVLSTSDAHVVSLVVHHIAADHWSAMVLFNDLLAAYRSRRAGQAAGVRAAAGAVRGLRGVASGAARRYRRTRCGAA